MDQKEVDQITSQLNSILNIDGRVPWNKNYEWLGFPPDISSHKGKKKYVATDPTSTGWVSVPPSDSLSPRRTPPTDFNKIFSQQEIFFDHPVKMLCTCIHHHPQLQQQHLQPPPHHQQRYHPHYLQPPQHPHLPPQYHYQQHSQYNLNPSAREFVPRRRFYNNDDDDIKISNAFIETMLEQCDSSLVVADFMGTLLLKGDNIPCRTILPREPPSLLSNFFNPNCEVGVSVPYKFFDTYPDAKYFGSVPTLVRTPGMLIYTTSLNSCIGVLVKLYQNGDLKCVIGWHFMKTHLYKSNVKSLQNKIIGEKIQKIKDLMQNIEYDRIKIIIYAPFNNFGHFSTGATAELLILMKSKFDTLGETSIKWNVSKAIGIIIPGEETSEEKQERLQRWWDDELEWRAQGNQTPITEDHPMAIIYNRMEGPKPIGKVTLNSQIAAGEYDTSWTFEDLDDRNTILHDYRWLQYAAGYYYCRLEGKSVNECHKQYTQDLINLQTKLEEDLNEEQYIKKCFGDECPVNECKEDSGSEPCIQSAAETKLLSFKDEVLDRQEKFYRIVEEEVQKNTPQAEKRITKSSTRV